MKKEKIKNILLIVIVALVTSFVTAYGVSSTFDSSNVCYKVDSSTGASVQDTIDDLYGRASDYSELNNRLSSVESHFDEAWLNLNGNNVNPGFRLKYNNVSRGSFYYNSNDDTTYLSANNSTGTGGQGTLNLIGNPVMINGENLVAVKYKDLTFDNVSITTKSAGGLYYSNYYSTGLTSSNKILSVSLKRWTVSSYNFNVALWDDNNVFFQSSNSITINQIQIRIIYI